MGRKMRNHKDIPGMGYWPDAPPSYGRDSSWDRKVQGDWILFSYKKPMTRLELEATLAYMDSATKLVQWRGSAECRICPTMREQGVSNRRDHVGALGSKCMLTPDEKWKFPESWQHYITVHGIRPTEEGFIKDALAWYIEKVPSRASLDGEQMDFAQLASLGTKTGRIKAEDFQRRRSHVEADLRLILESLLRRLEEKAPGVLWGYSLFALGEEGPSPLELFSFMDGAGNSEEGRFDKLEDAIFWVEQKLG